MSDFYRATHIAQALVEQGGALKREQSNVLAKIFLEHKAEALTLVRAIEQLQLASENPLSSLRKDADRLASGKASYAETLSCAVKISRNADFLAKVMLSISDALDEWPRPRTHEPEIGPNR